MRTTLLRTLSLCCLLILNACAAQSQTAIPEAEAPACLITRPDQLGPFYVPNAPLRSSVGEGHILSGVVRSSSDCTPIPNAQVEFWMVGPNAEYDDDHRATLFSDASGGYRFESNAAQPYANRPPHIHILVSAEGHQTLVTQYYPGSGASEGSFDLVLVPES